MHAHVGHMYGPSKLPTAGPKGNLMCAGHLVSGYVKQHLPILLVNHLSEGEDVGTGLSNGASCHFQHLLTACFTAVRSLPAVRGLPAVVSCVVLV